MVKNTAAKGAAIERIAIAILEADGYQVYRTIRSPYKGGANDVMGADLIAIKPGERVRVIQVTTKSVGITEKRREFEKWHWPAEHVSVEVWIWMAKKRKGITNAEHAMSRHFSIRLRDDDYDHRTAAKRYPLEGM